MIHSRMKRVVYAGVLMFCVFWVYGFAQATLLTYEGTQRCQWYDRWDSLVGSIDCMTELPTLPISEHVEYLLSLAQDVTTEYNAGEREFEYTPSDIIFDDSIHERVKRELDALTVSNETMVTMPKVLVAYATRERFKYVASTRDISKYGPCRKQNYLLAMNELNGVVLKPQELLNINKLIANKPWYCTWWGDYLFFSGVCGWSTQLFWNAILHPGLEVVERHSHGKRYAWFYWSTVMGDDSSIYERSKKLVIKNITQASIGFGTFVRSGDNNTVLVSAWESDQNWKTLIQKEQHGPRKALLRSTIYNGTTILQKDDRTSNYYGIDTSIDETAGVE